MKASGRRGGALDPALESSLKGLVNRYADLERYFAACDHWARSEGWGGGGDNPGLQDWCEGEAKEFKHLWRKTVKSLIEDFGLPQGSPDAKGKTVSYDSLADALKDILQEVQGLYNYLENLLTKTRTPNGAGRAIVERFVQKRIGETKKLLRKIRDFGEQAEKAGTNEAALQRVNRLIGKAARH